jgi:hypothetical protein
MIAGAVNLAFFHVAIHRFENKHGLMRGNADSISSAVAFGNYWR